MKRLILAIGFILTAFSLSACISQTTTIKPDDLSVNGTHFGEDCTPVVFGIETGTTTAEDAMRKARNREAMMQASRDGNGTGKHWIDVPVETIDKVRRIESTDHWFFLAFGARCTEVTGDVSGGKLGRLGPDRYRRRNESREGRVRFPIADRGLARREAVQLRVKVSGETVGPDGTSVKASAESGAGAIT